ncbi:MAG: hypothetical protein ACTS4T_01700 [Candidatus Hodgkinia cicadicola]
MFRVFIIFGSVNVWMSSLTVTVSGTDPTNLVSNFFPPLELYGEWYAGLLDFTTYNSIPNVIEGKNNEFPVEIGDSWNVVSLPTGSYEINNIEAYLKKEIGRNKVFLRANNNTLKCELLCRYNVNFTKSKKSIGSMLGFKRQETLQANITHESDAPVDILKVNTIQVQCNIVQGAYKNGEKEHTIHSFYPTVEPGFKIVETPNNVVYLPVNVQHVDNITLSLVDQDGDIIDFRGEVITIRVHLKKLAWWDCISEQ